MNALGARPYAEVAELIPAIKQQAEASLRLAEGQLKEQAPESPQES